ncbi:hypothetical protein BDW68DRAFT_31806 [Aspergillus falconensis]
MPCFLFCGSGDFCFYRLSLSRSLSTAKPFRGHPHSHSCLASSATLFPLPVLCLEHFPDQREDDDPHLYKTFDSRQHSRSFQSVYDSLTLQRPRNKK